MLAYKGVLLTWLNRGVAASQDVKNRFFLESRARHGGKMYGRAAAIRVAPSRELDGRWRSTSHAQASQHILLTHGGIGFGTRAAGSFGVSSG
jgi:hypothetical protein